MDVGAHERCGVSTAVQQKGAIGLVAAERGPHRGARISANELHLWRVGGVRCASEGNPAQLSASQGGICHRIRLVGSSERMKRRGARRAHRLNFWRTLCKCAPFAAAGGFAALTLGQALPARFNWVDGLDGPV